MTAENLTDLESHFAFGQNWADFATSVDDAAIREAEAGLEKLVDKQDIAGRSFIDIGCGSGLHSLAAARFGAARLLAADIDPHSTATAKALLEKHAPDSPWTVDTRSVFDMDPDQLGRFDIAYSWGVLHHTGNLDGAMRKAAAMVAPQGLFVFALYRRTPLDWFWIREKRWYANAGPVAQRRAQAAYLGLLRLGLTGTGRSYQAYVDSYRGRRGMNLRTDVHDWLGGFPYEPISPSEVDTMMTPLGFERVRFIGQKTRTGLLGSGCDEFVYRRCENNAGNHGT